VVRFLDLFVLRPAVVQKFLNQVALPGFGQLLVVLLKHAFDVAPLCGCNPLDKVLLRLIALLQENPVGVVVLVGFPFYVHYLLNDLLRALSVKTG
jgi:hypothetical protein